MNKTRPNSRDVRQRAIPVAGAVLALMVGGCGPTQALPTQTAPSAVAGKPYHYALNIQDGSDEHAYALENGSLPPGLRLDEDGTIRGTPTRVGGYRFTLSATGGAPGFVTSVFDVLLTVLEPLTLNFDLADAQVGVAYQETLTATGGTPPYAFEVVGLPGGLDFDPDTATLSGTPLNDDDALPLEVTVTDSGSPRQEITERVNLRIRPEPVVITTDTLPDGRAGTTYSQRITAEGGRPPYDWAVIDGLLPPGLRLGLGNGQITGTPTAVGVYMFTIRVRDDYAPVQSASRSYELEIQSP